MFGIPNAPEGARNAGCWLKPNRTVARQEPLFRTGSPRIDNRALILRVSRRALRDFADAHQDAQTPLDDWYRTTKRSRWTSLVDVRRTYPHADAVGEFTVFNIGGNKYRVAAYINYRTGKVYIRHVMTHEEYSGEDWKKR